MAELLRRRPLARALVSWWAICFGLACAVVSASAADLSELLSRKDLTPEGLARVVGGFTFELAEQVQAPQAFLQRKRGDCADFANLASVVLGHRGYSTKLVVVMMSRQTHVVCYVKEAGGFLDFNHRADANPLIESDGTLEDIADKVAGYFRSEWHMTSLFRYRNGSPVYLESVFPIEPFPAQAVAVRSQESRPTSNPPASSPAKTTRPATEAAVSTAIPSTIN